MYKKDLISRGIITAEQERTLFSNVEELEELNRCDVLAKFEARFKAVQETGAPLAIVNLGDIFLQLVWRVPLLTGLIEMRLMELSVEWIDSRVSELRNGCEFGIHV